MSDLGGNDLIVHAALRDELTKPIREVRREITRTKEEAEKLGRSGGVAGRGLDETERAAKRTHRTVGDLHRNLLSMSGTLGRVVTSTARTGAIALGVLGTAATGFGIKAAGSYQQAQIALETLVGTAEGGQRVFSQLQALNLKTPFELTDITSATQRLLAYGVSVDKLVPTLTGLVDVASLTGQGAQGLERLALALGQVVSTGRLQGDEARQFAEAGINVYEIYAERLGVTQAEVRRLGEAGQLSGEILLEALASMDGPLARFAGGAERANRTIFGQLSNLKDAFNQELAAAATPLVDMITADMPRYTAVFRGLIEQVGPPFFKLVGSLADLGSRALPLIGPPLLALTDGISQLLAAAVPGLQALSPVSEALASSIGQMVTGLLPVMPDLTNALVALIGLAPDLVDVLAAFTPLAGMLARTVTALLGFGPTRGILVGVLTALLGYRALSGIVGILNGFAGGLRGIGTAASGVSSNAPGAAAGIGRLFNALGVGAAAGTAAYGIAAGISGNDSPGEQQFNATIGRVAGYIGTGAMVGGPWGALGGVGAGIVDVGGQLLGAWGDAIVPGRTMAAHRRAAGGGSGLRITSGLRDWGLASGRSGHLSGSAVDVAGSGMASYAARVRRMGGFAVEHDNGSGRHVHADFGDVDGAGGARGGWGGGGDRYDVRVTTGPIHGQVDMQQAFDRALREAERRRRERAYDPVAP